MYYYRDVCDKTIEIKNKSKNFERLIQKELSKYIQTKYTIQILDFFDIDERFIGYINVHKKIDSILVN